VKQAVIFSGSGGVLRYAARISGWMVPIALIAVASPAMAQISVNRVEITFQPKGNDPRLGTIVLTNEGKTAVQAQVRLEDWDRAEDGTNRWYPHETLPGTCGKLLQIFPAAVSLDPGGSQAVRLMMDSTMSPTRECWSAAVVESMQPRVESGRNVTYAIRTAVKVYILPPAQPVEGELVALAIAPDSAAHADQLSLVFQNTGGRHVVAKGSVEFRRADNSVAEKVELPSLYTLPGARSRLGLQLPKLPTGRYIVLAVLDYGGDQLAAAQTDYEVP
jgi:P pilus assembly chaperone PapD